MAIKKFETVAQYNDHMGVDTLHPLVSMVDFNKIESIQHVRRYMGVYVVYLKDIKCGDLRYGCQSYDYEAGTLVFVAPGQVYGFEDEGGFTKPSGYGLVFHPDLILGTPLGQQIKQYTFFSYEVNEALHLSKREREAIVDCFEKVGKELEREIDQHSKTFIVSYIEMLLNLSKRFYDRQFITRNHVNSGLLSKFEFLMEEYLETQKAREEGLPSVRYFAERMNLSANYFGDLVKQETGKTAHEYIQVKVIDHAKRMVLDFNRPISDIAYELGFKYPQHFTRLFKQQVGQTPREFRQLN
ncbi:AraC family transcriptional regulator [Allomuricauda sp. NBRC 101325]|uniref:helix-turn-helix domain-containing protein n=1 Tax=Allomuricauda sp. NBRC 101325 TaxID=1113758 RepID=UPI0025529661|nr:helix-turn-helix domain-containing protein [Muricauda sp. NBRC 101325]